MLHWSTSQVSESEYSLTHRWPSASTVKPSNGGKVSTLRIAASSASGGGQPWSSYSLTVLFSRALRALSVTGSGSVVRRMIRSGTPSGENWWISFLSPRLT